MTSESTKLVKKLEVGAVFFLCQFVSYGVATWNFRAIANVRYEHVAVSALSLALVNFFVVSKIAGLRVNRYAALAGYAIGGTLGDVAVTYLTRHI